MMRPWRRSIPARAAFEAFSAWRVEDRDTYQLLLTDLQGRTRSWLMARPLPSGAGTRLHFGSAVLPRRDGATGRRSMGWGFRVLLGFHRLYSRLLLRAAATNLPA